MRKYIHISKTNPILFSIIITFLFLIFSIIFLTIFFNKNSRDVLVEQVQHRQQLATRTGAKSIGAFLRGVGRTVSVVAEDPSQTRLDNFVKNWSTEGVSGIVVVNKEGVVIAASNRLEKGEIGQKVIERGYFNWAKTAKNGEYFVSAPLISRFGSTKGEYILTVSSPILDSNDNFNGVVTAAILVSEVFNNHLSNIKVLETGNVYLVSQEGEVVYSDNQYARNKKISDIFSTDFLGKEKIIEVIQNEIQKDETKIELVVPNFSNNYKLEPYLVTASTVNLNDNLWKVVIAVGENDLNVFTYNYFNKQIIAIFVVLVIFIVLTIKLALSSGYQMAVGDEHKLHNLK